MKSLTSIQHGERAAHFLLRLLWNWSEDREAYVNSPSWHSWEDARNDFIRKKIPNWKQVAFTNFIIKTDFCSFHMLILQMCGAFLSGGFNFLIWFWFVCETDLNKLKGGC